MQLFAGELTNQNREYYKVNDNLCDIRSFVNYHHSEITEFISSYRRMPGGGMVKSRASGPSILDPANFEN